MKRVLSLVLALSMVLGMCTFAFAADLSDVDGQYYQASVEALVELGVVNGYPDGTYKANEVVTRAELAKMLVICLGQEEAAKIAAGSTQFTDVPAGHWAEGYINVATQYKVIVGYPDGTFLPEEPVTYAEAVTMVLRALGYKNVVESAGTWPTNYITKANELQLLKDARDLETDAGAKRGNVAIILWNMLRTEMWDIREENQTNGMTYGKTEEPMLNIKFPDYRYDDEYYFETLRVEEGRAYVTLYTKADYDEDGNLVNEDSGTEGELLKGDLLRLVPGMRVAALYNKEDEEFLTLTPMDTLVEGTVTDVTNLEKGRFDIDEVEYKWENNDEELAKDDYVVALVNGKKVKNVVVLPNDSKEVEKLRSVENDIAEDALVIIDGEWATRDDLEVGDVYTEIAGFGDLFYVVARERVNGTFESLSLETDEEKTDFLYLEVDGTEYRALASKFKAYEGEDNDKVVKTADLQKKAKENKYLDQEVELVLNYLGQVVKMYFGDVTELAEDGSFYAVMSDGRWDDSSASGRTYYIELAGADGEVETYEFKNRAVADKFGEEGIFGENAEPVFVWVKFDKNDRIEDIVVLQNGLKVGEDSKYTVKSFTAYNDETNCLNGTEGKVTSSTVVYTVTPVEDDDVVVGFEIEVSTGVDALEGVERGLYVYDNTSSTHRAKYVFVSEEAKSQDLHFGVVEKTSKRAGIEYVTIDGTTYTVSDDSEGGRAAFVVGELVVYTETDGEVTFVNSHSVEDLDNATKVTEVDDEYVTFTEGTFYDANPQDITLDHFMDRYEDYTIVTVDVTTAGAKDDYELSFDVGSAEELGKGIDNVTFDEGQRILVYEEGTVKYVIVVNGLELDDVTNNGTNDPLVAAENKLKATQTEARAIRDELKTVNPAAFTAIGHAIQDATTALKDTNRTVASLEDALDDLEEAIATAQEALDTAKETVLKNTTVSTNATEVPAPTKALEVSYDNGDITVSGSADGLDYQSLKENNEFKAYGMPELEDTYYAVIKLDVPTDVTPDEHMKLVTVGATGAEQEYGNSALDGGGKYICICFPYTADNQDVLRYIRVTWSEATPEVTYTVDLSGIQIPAAE